MKTIITTESCSDIPVSMLEKFNVPMVPFSVNFPDRTVLDGELPIQEIYDFYDSTRQIPKTCAISPYQYSQFFNRLLEDPEVEIVHIGYSSACSCSFQNATISLQDCDEKRIHLIDCLNVSGGFGLLTLKAVELHTRNPQWSAAELADEIRKWVPRIKTLFIPEKLDFLAAGGRVSNAAALGASLLRIKPRIDILKGELINTKKYYGTMQKAASPLVEDFLSEEPLDRTLALIIYAKGADPDLLEKLRQRVLNDGFQEVLVFELGAVMTVHGGKGAMGITGFRREAA